MFAGRKTARVKFMNQPTSIAINMAMNIPITPTFLTVAGGTNLLHIRTNTLIIAA
jgi:hypothetical protein